MLFLLCIAFSHCVNGKSPVNPLFVWDVLCSLDVCGPLCPLFAPSPWWYTPPDYVCFCFCLRWRGAIIFCMPVWRQPSGRSQSMADWFSSCYQILPMMVDSGICWLTLLVSLALLYWCNCWTLNSHLFRGRNYSQLISDYWYPYHSLQFRPKLV